MNQKAVSVDKSLFRSWLVVAAAVLFAASAILGVLAMGSLLHPDSIPAVFRDLELSQILDPVAQKTWFVIYIAVTAVNLIGTAVLSVGIFLVHGGKHYAGMDLMYHFSEWTLKFVVISGWAVLPYFILRALRYALMCMSAPEGLVPLMSMLMMEGLMGVQAMVLSKKLRQFMECSMDTTASIGYTLSSGVLKSPSIPGFSATGFLVLAIVDAGIAVDRFITMLHIQKNLSVTYKFPVTTDPVQILSGLSFVIAAVGSLALFFYLRRYKAKCERLLLHA